MNMSGVGGQPSKYMKLGLHTVLSWRTRLSSCARDFCSTWFVCIGFVVVGSREYTQRFFDSSLKYFHFNNNTCMNPWADAYYKTWYDWLYSLVIVLITGLKSLMKNGLSRQRHDTFCDILLIIRIYFHLVIVNQFLTRLFIPLSDFFLFFSIIC